MSSAQPLVSVIIPIYNLQLELLEACLASVLAQSYQTLELIVVDDGSKDELAARYAELCSTDERVRLIRQDNAGVAVARNTGTMAARGEYICYVDGDDLLLKDALKEGIDLIDRYDAELVIAAFAPMRSHATSTSVINDASREAHLLSAAEIEELRQHYFSPDQARFSSIGTGGKVSRAATSRLIKSSIARENPFIAGIEIGEDTIWDLQLLDTCSRICFVESIWYAYLVNPVSALHRYWGDRPKVAERFILTVEKMLPQYCETKRGVFGKFIAREFKNILRYELRSPDCPMSAIDKIAFVRSMLTQHPWSVLREKKALALLPREYRLLVLAAQTGSWLALMRLRYGTATKR